MIELKNTSRHREAIFVIIETWCPSDLSVAQRNSARSQLWMVMVKKALVHFLKLGFEPSSAATVASNTAKLRGPALFVSSKKQSLSV